MYAELPYCEYIYDRGGLCAYISAFHSFPFPKFSYDLIHIAWLFHMYSGQSLVKHLLEVDRILRPGGFLWWEGGFSNSQKATVYEWADSVGYSILYEESEERMDGTKWGTQIHECDITVVFIKSSRSQPRQCNHSR